MALFIVIIISMRPLFKKIHWSWGLTEYRILLCALIVICIFSIKGAHEIFFFSSQKLTSRFFSIWVLLITWETHQEVVVWLIFYNVASNVFQWQRYYTYKICWELSTFLMAVPAAVGDYTKRPSEAARRLQEAMCALTKTCVTY